MLSCRSCRGDKDFADSCSVPGDRDAKYEDFLSDLQKGGDSECRLVNNLKVGLSWLVGWSAVDSLSNIGDCRYGLYDFEYEHQCQGTTESSKKQKLFLMSWCPDSAKVATTTSMVLTWPQPI